MDEIKVKMETKNICWQDTKAMGIMQDLQGRLQSLDMSSAELDTKIEEATAPLLQQIDMLQTQHSAALKHRDHAEQEVALRLQTIEKERDEYKALLQDMSNKYSAAVSNLCVILYLNILRILTM